MSLRLRSGQGTCAALLVAALLATSPGEAHKPITSPYSFNEHVFPILKAHCAACHVAGGVAPMSLMTHAEAVPWGESMRLELIAGRMPPFVATSAVGVAHSKGLSARELDTLMTWASGGTPEGDPSKVPEPVSLARRWPLGEPDEILALPEQTVGADSQERLVELRLPYGPKALRALDIRPGTPALLRSAAIRVGDRTLLAWQPGDRPKALTGAAFTVPAGMELSIQLRYVKTWSYERQPMRDRSEVGLYLASGSTQPVETVTVPTEGLLLDRETRVLAVAPGGSTSAAPVTLDAVHADGRRLNLITFTPREQWLRRHWFDSPVPLPRGTRLTASAPVSVDVASP